MNDELQRAILAAITQATDTLPAAAQDLVARELMHAAICSGIGVLMLVGAVAVAIAWRDDGGPAAGLVIGCVAAIFMSVGLTSYYSVLWYPRAYLLDYARGFVN